ncbi:type III secretion system translocon subunit SctE [Chitinimonas lacunae]|uniref:Type III secretion system translocon subunit SctE n=1 Tax=Chitinimonas lacunae TaxID=1963018 RepID=A0ABV8MSV0_9NEIS
MTIQSINVGNGNLPVANDPTALAQSVQVNAAAVAQITEIAAQYLQSVGGNVGGNQGGRAPQGAPELEAPRGDFSSDQLALLLMSLQNKSEDAQLQTAKQGLEISKQQKEDMHKRAIEKIEEAARKAAEAAEKAKANKVLGWFTKVFAFVAAVVATVAAAVATVATGGAAAPLLALAVMGLVATGMDLANQISQECGGPEISLSKWVTEGCAKLLTAMGMSEEDAKKYAPILAAVAATVVSAGATAMLAPDLYGNAVGAICQLCGVDEQTAQYIAMAVTLAVQLTVAVAMVVATGGSSAVSGVAKTAQNVGKIAGAVGQGVNGALGVAQGGLTISQADSQKQADLAKSQKAEFDKMIVKLKQQMEDERERIKELLEQLDMAAQMVSQMIAAASSTRVQQVRNIV